MARKERGNFDSFLCLYLPEILTSQVGHIYKWLIYRGCIFDGRAGADGSICAEASASMEDSVELVSLLLPDLRSDH